MLDVRGEWEIPPTPFHKGETGLKMERQMETVAKSNIYENIPTTSDKELFDIIAQNGNVRIERIVSFGQCSPEGFFYDQDEDEFVILLEGNATVSFEDGTAHNLKKGDYLNIPRHVKHRVDFTSNPAVWLAVFYKGQAHGSALR